jgi:hypothetical protein
MATKPVGQRPTTTKPLPGRPGPSEDEQQEQQPQRQARSKAEMFNNAEPESGFNVPLGPYVAHLVDAQHEKDDTNEKESVKMSYEVAEGEQEGKTINAWYNLFDKDGNPQRGSGFLKRDMALMGGPELDYDQLQSQLDELTAERPLCNLLVKDNKGYTHGFCQGLAEGR